MVFNFAGYKSFNETFPQIEVFYCMSRRIWILVLLFGDSTNNPITLGAFLQIGRRNVFANFWNYTADTELHYIIAKILWSCSWYSHASPSHDTTSVVLDELIHHIIWKMSRYFDPSIILVPLRSRCFVAHLSFF